MKRIVNGREVELEATGTVAKGPDRLYVATPEGTRSALVVRSGDTTWVSVNGSVYAVEKPRAGGAGADSHSSGELRAPMPGAIVDVLVSVGDKVTKGQKIVVLEAMKTQLPSVAPFDGVVEQILVKVGDQVAAGQLLAVIGKAEA